MTATNARRSRSAEPEVQRRDGPRPMHISLRAGEKLFLNGAVIRVDRKVTLELLNDATFLLENHVLQVEDTTTPMRQLYFAVQAMLMDPQNAPASRALFEAMAADMKSVLTSRPLLSGIDEASAQVDAGRPFHALKTLRGLFAEEAAVLGAAPRGELPQPVRQRTEDPTPLARDRTADGARATSAEGRAGPFDDPAKADIDAAHAPLDTFGPAPSSAPRTPSDPS